MSEDSEVADPAQWGPRGTAGVAFASALSFEAVDVRLGHRTVLDRFSLAFCLRGWDDAGEPFEVGSFRFEPVGPWRTRVSPWPFAQPEIDCSLVRRLVPKRPWRQQEFRDAFFGLPAERVSIGFVE